MALFGRRRDSSAAGPGRHAEPPPAPLPDPAAATAQLTEMSWDEVRPRLRFVSRRASLAYERLVRTRESDGRTSICLGTPSNLVWTMVVVDHGTHRQTVHQTRLAAWGLVEADVLNAAVNNHMAQHPPEDVAQLVAQQSDPMQPLLDPDGDHYWTSLPYLWGWLERASAAHPSGDLVAVMPDENQMLLVPRERAAEATELALSAFQVAPNALSAVPQIKSPVGDCEDLPSAPDSVVARARYELKKRVYDEQRAFYQDAVPSLKDRFISDYQIYRNDDGSYWSATGTINGIPSLLPAADEVGLMTHQEYSSGSGPGVTFPFAVLRDVCGLKVFDRGPARYLFDGASDEQIAEMTSRGR